MSVLGIDIGGTKVAMAVAGPDGEPRHSHREPTTLSGDPRRDVESMVTRARALLDEARAAGLDPIERVGVALPGALDPARRLVLHSPNLPGWREVPIADWLAEALGVPVALENDANAAALAEWRFGAGQGSRNLVFLTMSTGVGGGLVLDGRLHRGAFGGAGEIGHAPVEFPGVACRCGLHGCLEGYVGGNAWRDRLRERTPASSRVFELAGREAAAIRPEHLVEAARAGDSFACGELSRWLDYLARGLVFLVMTLEPERIVLGTIAVAAGRALCFDPLHERVAAALWPHQAERLEIVPAALGRELPLRAAVAVALQAD